ncbi:MAG: sialate O-acetylesterase, partial [Bacteroidaceae bacterium]|nr:sialate O-acetylesterase [Bacteroidaceae bacterium]
MVLQQQSDVNIWGTADAGKTVTITASWDKKAKFSAKAGNDGKWKIAVKTPQAGGPYSVTISDGQSVTLNNVLVGEVWLCAGQSNMEMPMKGFKCQPVENGNRDAVLSTNPNMRLFTVKRSSSLTPKDDVVGSWLMANAESVREFSATAFYFGRMLQMVKPDVPVGLIVTAWGGSACEAWMDEKMLADFPSAQIPRTQEDIKSKNRTPTVLYNGMLHPVIGYGIRGAIWYQGEDNWNRAETYSDMMASMVSGWRAQWGIGDFPFYYCQIAPYDYSIITEKGQPIYNTAYLREQQVLALQKISNSGMACL